MAFNLFILYSVFCQITHIFANFTANKLRFSGFFKKWSHHDKLCPDLVMDSAAEAGEGEDEEAGRTEEGVAGGGASGPSGSGTRATGDMRGQEIK